MSFKILSIHCGFFLFLPVCPNIFKFLDEQQEQSTGGRTGYQVLSCSHPTATVLLPQPSFPFTISSYKIFQFAKFSRTGTAFTTVVTHCISIIININIIIIVETQSHKCHKSPVPHIGSCFTCSQKNSQTPDIHLCFCPLQIKYMQKSFEEMLSMLMKDKLSQQHTFAFLKNKIKSKSLYSQTLMM